MRELVRERPNVNPVGLGNSRTPINLNNDPTSNSRATSRAPSSTPEDGEGDAQEAPPAATAAIDDMADNIDSDEIELKEEGTEGGAGSRVDEIDWDADYEKAQAGKAGGKKKLEKRMAPEKKVSAPKKKVVLPTKGAAPRKSTPATSASAPFQPARGNKKKGKSNEQADIAKAEELTCQRELDLAIASTMAKAKVEEKKEERKMLESRLRAEARKKEKRRQHQLKMMALRYKYSAHDTGLYSDHFASSPSRPSTSTSAQ